jgi:hypothetical protein
MDGAFDRDKITTGGLWTALSNAMVPPPLFGSVGGLADACFFDPVDISVHL